MPDTSTVPLTGLRGGRMDSSSPAEHSVFGRSARHLMPIRKLYLQIHSNALREGQSFSELKPQNCKMGEEKPYSESEAWNLEGGWEGSEGPLRSQYSSVSWVLGRRKKNRPTPSPRIGVTACRALHKPLNSQGSSPWNGDSGTNGPRGATAYKRIKMFRRHLVNTKRCTNGNNNVKFYLTSSLRTPSRTGRLLMKSAESTKLITAGNSVAGQANAQGIP